MDAIGFARSHLLAFVDDDIPAGAPSAIEQAVRDMATAHDWTVEPPEAVDQVDDGDRTVGVVLALYAPRSDDGRRLPVELDQDSVGWVVNGNPDESLSKGLLGEWARVLGSS